MTKKIIITFFLILSSILTYSQNWQWAKSAVDSTSSATNEFYSIAADPNGNAYITGTFATSSITFGTYTLSGSVGDIFLAKYDSSGTVLWATSPVGSGGVYNVATDALSNIYLFGSFGSNLVFGTDTLTGPNLFLVKYNSSGTVLWAKTLATGTNVPDGSGLTTDINDNVYITGYYFNSAIFATDTLTSLGSADVFLAKYNSAGNLLWAKSAGGIYSEAGVEVITDRSGDILLTGYYISPSFYIGTFILTNGNNFLKDGFIAKYDSTGAVLWAKSIAGPQNENGNAVATDSSNNVYLTGNFSSLVTTIGTDTLNNSNSNTYDVYLAKFSSSGNVLWARSASGPDNDNSYSIATDRKGYIYIAGGFGLFWNGPHITFGSVVLPAPAGSVDPMFIIKYDSSGNAICGLALASGGDDQNGIAVDVNGNVYAGGDFECNPFSVGTTTLSLYAREDIFIARANFDCPISSVHNLSTNKRINIYPNPTSNQFLIESNTSDKLTLDLYDVQGRHVLNKNANGNSNIDVTTLDEGVYTVTIKTDQSFTTKKLIVLR